MFAIALAFSSEKSLKKNWKNPFFAALRWEKWEVASESRLKQIIPSVV